MIFYMLFIFHILFVVRLLKPIPANHSWPLFFPHVAFLKGQLN